MKIFIIILSIIAFSSCSTSDTPDEVIAEVEVQMYVESLLKAPSTAEFGRATVYKTDSTTFRVSNTVDAQNGFGAMVRQRYSAVIEFTKGGKKYKIKEFEFR